MIFELARGRKFSVYVLEPSVWYKWKFSVYVLEPSVLYNVVAPWKFDVLKTSIFALEASLLRHIFV